MARIHPNYNSREKENVRSIVGKGLRSVGSILTLTTPDLYDVLNFKSRGVIDIDTHITVAEETSSVLNDIVRSLIKLGYRENQISTWEGDVRHLSDQAGPFDLVNLDFMTPGLSHFTFDFLRSLKINDGGELAVWLTPVRPEDSCKFRDDLRATFTNTDSGLDVLRDIRNSNKAIYGIQDGTILWTMAAIATSLTNYRFKIESHIRYRSNIQLMTVYRFTDFKRTDKPLYPSLRELWQNSERKIPVKQRLYDDPKTQAHKIALWNASQSA